MPEFSDCWGELDLVFVRSVSKEVKDLLRKMLCKNVSRRLSAEQVLGVKATYLLAVAFLEFIRFSSNGGILNGGVELTASRSAFSCVFEYLKMPNLAPAIFSV
ncbi:hypothetical protein Droror1_Dr00027278 [Drosera rotundifolia]